MHHPEQAIFTNMCMVYDNAGNILVQDRRKKDWPGLCFPGGHVEPGESFVKSVIREVWEETGLTIETHKSAEPSNSRPETVPGMCCCFTKPTVFTES